jgi:hypothetical protein
VLKRFLGHGSSSPRHTMYLEHRCVATEFWCGEDAAADNDFISNVPSAWCDDWVESFGGVDDPHHRDGYLPAGFQPKENPFYVALPYGDYDDEGVRPNVSRIPWHKAGPDDYPENGSLLKNRWVEVRHRGRTAYGQWEDVGPNEEDDPDFVFGAAEPKNTFGERAGIDLSPALCHYLGIDGSGNVVWRFVEADDVPRGPWSEITTITGPQWA